MDRCTTWEDVLGVEWQGRDGARWRRIHLDRSGSCTVAYQTQSKARLRTGASHPERSEVVQSIKGLTWRLVDNELVIEEPKYVGRRSQVLATIRRGQFAREYQSRRRTWGTQRMPPGEE